MWRMPVSVRPTTIQPITLRELQVLRVEDVTPTMRRLVLGGDQLEPFERDGFELPEFVSLGFDDHVKIFFPDPVSGRHVLPTQLARRIEWSDDPAPIARSYTVRSFDGTEVAIDVVVHSAGVATAWALACARGDPIWLAGPKMGMLLPESTDWLLLAGDETALPAIARCLEELPSGMPAQVIVEVDGPESEQDLLAPDGVEIRWLHRGGAEPGTTTLLEDAIRDAEWWPGEAFAWVAGETMTLRPIRALLRDERGMPRERLDIAAYWRRREHDPTDLLENGMRPDALEELGDLLAPYAIRAAVTLGIGEALADGPAGLDRLAAASGADPGALGRLLRYLAVRGIVEGDPAGYALTAQGAALAGEDADAYDLRLPLARLELTAARLLDAVRTGRAQADVDALRAADPALDAALQEHAREELAFAAPAFGEEIPFAPGEQVVCCGDGVLELVDAALRAGEPPAVTLLAGARVGVGAWPEADTVLVSGLLEQRTDADVADILARARAALRPGGRILVLAEVRDEEDVHEHDAEEDLMLLCLHGTGARTRAEWGSLFSAAGLHVAERPIGWGRPLFELTPA
jgi:NADPH-dependent ferric siderophore reductase